MYVVVVQTSSANLLTADLEQLTLKPGLQETGPGKKSLVAERQSESDMYLAAACEQAN